ncbi:hypothetical protein L2E82_12653 [Cichorium intybus]|uniref:Uncharacterized protein n=1 Tax=Cichorium intybus TaxID=13427 RepID=A0ACB9GHB1_CICIN|nr:hypothetical protein L2E82_12653 [Cichorium intybus]
MRTPSTGGMEIYISDTRTRPYISATGVTFNNSTTTAILTYQNTTTSLPLLPVMPSFNDTPTAFKFMSNLTDTGLDGATATGGFTKVLEEN